MACDLRQATLDDVPVLLDMMVEFNVLEHIAWSRVDGEPALRTLLASPALGFVGLIESDARVVGYFVLTWGYDLEWNGRDAFLTELFLTAEARGQGIGGAAMAAIEGVTRAHGAHALHLMVRPENAAALRLYRGAGFETTPRLFLTKTFREKSP